MFKRCSRCGSRVFLNYYIVEEKGEKKVLCETCYISRLFDLGYDIGKTLGKMLLNCRQKQQIDFIAVPYWLTEEYKKVVKQCVKEAVLELKKEGKI